MASIHEFITPFEKATRKTLSEMCSVAQIDARILDAGQVPQQHASIAGLIGITSKHFTGSMTILFTSEVFLSILNQMLGEKFDAITDELEDGAAELTNIIFGNAKIGLNEAGHAIQMALPNVLRGEDIVMSAGKSEFVQAIEFKIEAGLFWICFQLDTKLDLAQPAAIDPNKKNVTLNADVMLEFVKSVRKTFQIQFSSDVIPAQPFIKKRGTNEFTFDVGSIIGVTAAGFSGSFAMYYEKKTFLQFINTMLGTDFTELTDEIQDGASEITNICFGVAKQVLNERGHAIQMALPSLIRGHEIHSTTQNTGKTSAIVVPLKSPQGNFWLEFAFMTKEVGG